MDEGKPSCAYDVVILGANNYRIGRNMNGGGYRYLELALTLQDLGVRVAILAPEPTDFKEPPVVVLNQSELSDRAISSLARVFIFCLLERYDLVNQLREDGKVLIYDSYLSPVEQLTFEEVVVLEDEEEIYSHFETVVDKQNAFNGMADYFIVGERSEKLLKLGEMISTHCVTSNDYLTLGERIYPLPVIGYSRHHDPGISSAPTSNKMLWSGGLWNHYSGTDLIVDAVKSLRATGYDITFSFLYPRKQTAAHAAIARRIEQDHLPFIELGLANGSHPDFFEKQEVIAASRALVLLYEPNLQMHLFLSMRLREVLVFEKPIIVSKYGIQGAFVNEHGIGLTVDNTVESVSDAMTRMIDDPALYDRLVKNIRHLKQSYELLPYVRPIADAIVHGSVSRAVASTPSPKNDSDG